MIFPCFKWDNSWSEWYFYIPNVMTTHRDSLSAVRTIFILSSTAGTPLGDVLPARWKALPMSRLPRSAISTLLDVDLWGTMMTGAFSLMSSATRDAVSCRFFAASAEYSATASPASFILSFAVWKLSRKPLVIKKGKECLGQVRSGQVRSERLTCTFRASCWWLKQGKECLGQVRSGQVRVFNVHIQSKLLMIETRKGVFRSGQVRSGQSV